MAMDSGDTAWVLTSTCLVLMMTLPGLALFYGGLSGFKSVLSTCLQTIAITSLISLCWLMFGYSLAFGDGCRGLDCAKLHAEIPYHGFNSKLGNAFIGGSEKFWLWNTATHDLNTISEYKNMLPGAMKGTIPESVFIMFQLTFAIITACITAGSFAERMKFHSMLIFFFFWHFLVYCIVAHWLWTPQGYLAQWGAIDFAGGFVVHIVSGVSGVVGSVILGPRKPDKVVRSETTVLMTFIGGSMLWVGWFGFNAGSALTAGKSAGMAMLVTHIAASTTCFFWMIMEWLHKGNPTLVGAVSGAITGLVVITPASGYVDQTGAFAMGLLGAICCYPAVVVKNKLSLDEKASISDYPDAFGVHAIGGMVGAFWTGMFANPDINSQSGAFYFNDKRLAWQIVAIIFVVLWSATLTAILMLILKFTIGINVAEPAEPDPETDHKSSDQKAESFQYFLPNTPPPAFQTIQYHPVVIPVTGTAVFGPPSFKQHPLVPIGAAMVPMGPPPMHATPPPMHAPHGSHGYA